MSSIMHRLVEYDTTTGDKKSTLLIATDIDAAAPLNDISSFTGSVVSLEADDSSSRLTAPAEFAIELSDDEGLTWVEPPNFRFAVLRDSADALKTGETGTISGVGIASLLNKALVVATVGEPLDTDGRRYFNSEIVPVYPGLVLRAFLEEAQDRGALSWITYGFTSSTDTNGTAWPTALDNIAFEIGTNLYSVLDTFTASGLIDWRMQGRTLQVFVVDTEMNDDLTDTVQLSEGKHFTEGGIESTAEELASYHLIRGDGITQELLNESATEPWGRFEASVSASGSDDEATLSLLAQLYQTQCGTVRSQRTLQVASAADPDGPQPWFDYSVGDTVRTRYSDELEDLRCRQLTFNYSRDNGTRVTLVVGDRLLEWETRLTRRLSGAVGGTSGEVGNGSTNEPIGDLTIPDSPDFGPALTAVYQTVTAPAQTKAQVYLQWDLPTNQDGTTITDGKQFVIRYRPNASLPYRETWDEVSSYSWDEIDENTWNQPLISPITDIDWHYITVPWDSFNTMVHELTPAVEYEFQIRAEDWYRYASPWSDSMLVTMGRDTVPPSKPAAPTVVGNRMNIQITHTLGVDAGGEYNLEADTVSLEVHGVGQPEYACDSSTLIGTITDIGSSLSAGVPVVQSFHFEHVEEFCVKVVAVDKNGNKSEASDSAYVTAELIDDAHISDLTVSKVTAGSLSAEVILAGSIKTGTTESRVELTSEGLYAYDDAGEKTVEISADDGSATISGKFKTSFEGMRIEIVDESEGFSYPTMFFVVAGTDPDEMDYMAFINAAQFVDDDGDHNTAGIGINSGHWYRSGVQRSTRLYMTDNIELSVIDPYQVWQHGAFWLSDGTMKVGNSNGYLYIESTGQFHLLGKFRNSTSWGAYADECLIVGNYQVASGTSVAYLYGPTMSSTLMPACTIYDNVPHTWFMSAYSSTGFTMNIGEAPSGSWRVLFVAAGY